MTATRVSPVGLFAFALYRKTRFCFFWTWEKRWYANASPRQQHAHSSLQKPAFTIEGRDFKQHVANYQTVRGMNCETDVHDWMDGYPYESVEPDVVKAELDRRGFHIEQVFEYPAIAAGLCWLALR